jgi:hypothetical protein
MEFYLCIYHIQMHPYLRTSFTNKQSEVNFNVFRHYISGSVNFQQFKIFKRKYSIFLVFKVIFSCKGPNRLHLQIQDFNSFYETSKISIQ